MAAFGNTFGNGLVQHWAKVNPLLPWMEAPYFALPENGVALLTGEEVTIYGDALINVAIGNDLKVTYTCEIGNQVGNNLVLLPVIAGIYPLTIVCKNGNRVFETKTINLSVIAKNEYGAISILEIADSTVDEDIEVIGAKTESILLNNTITYLGTRGTTRKHEARPGWSYNSFVSNVASPFVKAGALNIPAYFADNAIATPDLVYLRCGINDIFWLSVSSIPTILSEIDALVNGFLAYNSALNIVIALPTTCVNTTTDWNNEYDEVAHPQNQYIEDMHRFWKALTDRYANSAYNVRVGISYEAIHLNRAIGYANSVHLTTFGNNELGSGFAPYLNQSVSKLQDSLILASDVIERHDFTLESSITKIGNVASMANDLSGNENHLRTTGTSDTFPIWDAEGLLTDGISQWMQTFGYAYNQPATWYIVFKQLTWDSKFIIDGVPSSTAMLQRVASPQFSIAAGVSYSATKSIALDAWCIATIRFDGVNSSLRIDRGTSAVGDFGAANPGGFTIGASGGGSFFGNCKYKGAILKNVNDSTATEANIYNTLKKMYGL